jgi:LCP family protein required for cell wall assembly
LRSIALWGGMLLMGFASTVAGFSLAQHKSPIQVIAEPFVRTPQQVFGKSNLLVLAVGLDYDYNAKDEEYSTQSRSDVIKVINIDFDRKQIYELSIPRDMDATMPNGSEAKINQAQSEGGITEAQSVISRWLGVPGFDRYVVLRINSVKEIISAIGGVDIDVKDSDCLAHHDCKNQSTLNYVDTWGHLNIHLKPGLQHLDGPGAVGYARFRHDWCSDPCRLMRQDQVIRAMVEKLKGDKLNTMLHAGQLIGIIQHNVTTNLNSGEMLALANYFIDISQKQIHQEQVPYVDVKTIANYGEVIIPDRAAKAKLVHDMLLAPPVPQPSPDAMTLAAIPPASLRVEIQNASGVPGAARKLADDLHSKGFIIGAVGNAPASGEPVTEIHEHSRTAFAGAKVRSALPMALQATAIVTDADPATLQTQTVQPASDVTIVIGKDLAAATTAAVSAAGTAPRI